MATLETPSRIMRRIHEASLVEMPSLPSFPMIDSDDGPGDPMYPSNTPSEEHERSITSFPTDPTESAEPGTRITSTPLLTGFRKSGSNSASGSRFVNSLHTTLLPNGTRRENSLRTSPIESSVASTVKPVFGRKSSYGSRGDVENGRGIDITEESSLSVVEPIAEEDTVEEEEEAEESVPSQELHEAQESFISSAPPNLAPAEYEEYQVSVRSAPMPSPKDPMQNINMRRRSSPHIARQSKLILSDSSFSTISEEGLPVPERSLANLPEPEEISRSITPPNDTPRSIRNTSHLKRAYSSSPIPVLQDAEESASNTTPKLPPLPVSSPMGSHFTTIASPHTPAITTSNLGTARRRSYLLSVLSSTKPRIRATPHPHKPPIRRTPHPLVRVSLERRASFATATTSTPSTNNDLTTNLRANTSFDPATGETRFNVAKMNGYLHQLNEKLVEENLGLHLALKEYASSSNSTHSGSSGLHLPSSHNSVIPEESVAQAEEWHYVVASLREELDTANAANEHVAEEAKVAKINLARKETEWEATRRNLQRDLDQAKVEAERWEDKAKQEAEEKATGLRKHQTEMKLAEEGIDVIVKDLEARVKARDREIQSLREKVADELSTESEHVRSLQERLEVERRERDAEREKAREQMKDAQGQIDELKQALASSGARVQQMSGDAERLAGLVEELRSLQPRLDQAEATAADQHILLGHKDEELDTMRAWLSDLSQELTSSQDKVQELEAALKDKDEELDLERRLPNDTIQPSDEPAASVPLQEHEIAIAELQAAVDRADREIGNLRHQLSKSPSKDAIAQAQKSRMEKLQAENDSLREALGLLRTIDDMHEAHTPARKNMTMDPLTPSAVHKSILALKVTATPGSPLKELSFMNNTTFSTAHIAPLLAEIMRLKDEVAVKEQKVDDELDGLQDAFGRNNEILRRLQDEIDRREQLQADVNVFTRRERVLNKRLARLKCGKCKKRFDASDVLHVELGDVEQSIDQLEISLNLDASETRAERDELKALADELLHAQREKDGITSSLEQKQSELDVVKGYLQDAKQENQDLQAALKAKDTSDRQNRVNLERVKENQDAIRKLREERASLLSGQTILQRNLDHAQDHLERLRQEKASREAAVDRYRLELDDMAEELRSAEQEKERLQADGLEVQRTIRGLESDLGRLRHEADHFGRDLSDLQSEKERMEAKRKEERALSDRQRQRAATEIRLLGEQLAMAQARLNELETAVAEHACESDPEEITKLRLQHKQECKGLVVQIHYLKDMFRRETTLRSDLGYQKRYLLRVIAQTTKQPVSRVPSMIACLRQQQKVTLRSVVQAVIFLSRTKICSEKWREQKAHRPNMYAALEDVRRRRVAST